MADASIIMGAGDTTGSRVVFADAALAVVFVTMLLVDMVGTDDLRGPAWLAVALNVAMAVPLAFRRRYPATSYAANTLALVVQATFVLVNGLYPYTNLVGIYSAGAYATPRRARASLPIGLAGVAAYFTASDVSFVAMPLVVGAFWTLAWATGYTTARGNRERAEQHIVAIQGAATDERSRIAREIHDVIGHTVNVMVVQAGAGRRIIDRDPGRAKDAMAVIEETGRSALAELDRVLGFLRDDGPEDRAPQPGLADLDGLPGRFAVAGLNVHVAFEGQPPPMMSRSLEVSAYRIVTEALTNTLKHAQAGTATVRVRFLPDRLEVEVVDDGSSDMSGSVRPGRGLTGIAERVTVFGGDLEHGPRPGGGFALRVSLPVPAS